MANTIADSLNISEGVLVEYDESTAEVSTTVKNPVDLELETNSNADYVLARDNIRDLITTGSSIIPELANLATLSESARVYEVLATSIKNLADMNKTLLELTKQQLENNAISNPNNPKSGVKETDTTNNNYLHVGSTEDLLKMIRDNK